MVSEQELIDAIRACEREPLTPSKISKLADFYIIYDHLFGTPYPDMASYSEPPAETVFHTSGESEFLTAINGRRTDVVLPIINELVETVKVLHPQMYTHLLDKIINE